MTTMTASEANARANDAWSAFMEARKVAYIASAEAMRHWLREEVDDVKTNHGIDVVGLRFSTEFVYNDEGGYFESVSVALLDGEEGDIDYSDVLESYGPEVVRVFFGCSPEEESGTMTLEEAEKVVFKVEP